MSHSLVKRSFVLLLSTPTTEFRNLSLHDALPISVELGHRASRLRRPAPAAGQVGRSVAGSCLTLPAAGRPVDGGTSGSRARHDGDMGIFALLRRDDEAERTTREELREARTGAD